MATNQKYYYMRLRADFFSRVEKALQIFIQLGLVEQLPDNSYFMMELEGMVGKTSTEADRKRITRANVKAIKEQESDKCPPNVQALSEKCPPEIKIEKEIYIKTELDSDREIYGRYKNVSLTPSEYESLKNEYPVYADKYIEKLSEYMETKGKSYSNHYATILSWLKQDIKPTNYSCKEGESL